MALTARAAAHRLTLAAEPARVPTLLRFFKTGAGDYGEGDRFLGVTVPDLRRIAKEFRDLPLAEIERLMDSPWHEARGLAMVILADTYGSAEAGQKTAIYRLYLRRTDRINNWDLVDSSAAAVVGAHLFERSRAPLRRLARSRHLWDRRIAIIATHYFIRRGQYADTLDLAELLLGDTHDLMHKAVGWMLREVGNRDEPALRRFLDRHAATMPRTALRYALERLPAAARRRYMSARFRE